MSNYKTTELIVWMNKEYLKEKSVWRYYNLKATLILAVSSACVSSSSNSPEKIIKERVREPVKIKSATKKRNMQRILGWGKLQEVTQFNQTCENLNENCVLSVQLGTFHSSKEL